MKEKRQKNARSVGIKTHSATTHSNQRWTVPAICIFLAVITFAVFWQTTRYEFTNYDDPVYVTENPTVTAGLTSEGIVSAFGHGGPKNWDWVPLTTLSHMVDCQSYGLQPRGHHLTNVLLHTASVILLFVVLWQMTGAVWRCALVAAIFAIHPLRVESVAWVTERKDVLSGLFCMLTLLAYVRYVRNVGKPRSLARYLVVVLLFACGLMSKAMLVTLPFVLLLLDYWPLKRSSSSVRALVILEKIPLLLLSITSCLLTVLALGHRIEPLQRFPLSLRIENALVSWVTYITQLFYPVKLAVLYPYPIHGWPLWEWLGALLLLALITLGAVVWRRKRPYLLVGWLWFLGMLVPVIGIVQSGEQAHADRFTYLPGIGLALVLAWLAAELTQRWRNTRFVVITVAVGSVVGMFLLARQQAVYWKNSESLWTYTIACTPDNAIAYNDLGQALLQKGHPDEAIVPLQKALSIRPDYVDAEYNLGTAFSKKGQLDEAIVHLQRALAIQPDFPEAHNDLGTILFQKGNIDDALLHLQRAVTGQPDYAGAQNNLGYVLLKKGKIDEAIVQLQTALKLQPDNAEAHNNLGAALVQKGQADEAIVQLQRALEIDPAIAKAHNSLAAALLQKEKPDEAIVHLKKELQRQPDEADAYYNYGVALLQKRQIDDAISLLRRALELQPDHANAHNNLGYALLQKGQVDESIAHLEKAITLQPNYADARNNLGNALFQKGKVNEAAVQFQKAVEINPNSAEAHNSLGAALFQEGQVDDAITQLQKALVIQPAYAEAHNNLGTALMRKELIDAALTNYQQALENQPGNVQFQNNLARILWKKVTSADPALRNEIQTLDFAQKADQISGGNNPLIVATLAESYAAAGKFSDAITNAQRALQLASNQNNTDMIEVVQAQLKRYQAGVSSKDAATSR